MRDLRLPDCWVAAGFVRNAVWDLLHGYAEPTPLADVDVLFFRNAPDDAYDEQALEATLTQALPQHCWQARNQARMHHVNGFAPFCSSAHAMCHWVETPTATGLALDRLDRLQINAPLGVGDLMSLRVQPGPMFRDEAAGNLSRAHPAQGLDGAMAEAAGAWPVDRVAIKRCSR